MADPKCTPPCAPNAPIAIPGVTPDPAIPTAPPVTPPTPIAVQTETCAGVVAATVFDRVEAVIPPGTVVYTKKCPTEAEFDTSVLCDPNTGASVLVVTTYSATGVPTPNAYNTDGTPYAGAIGALVACGSSEESDAEVMCDNGVEFLRWFVKKNGTPTGVTFDTDMNGAGYVPTGPVTRGPCAATSTSTTYETRCYCIDRGGVQTTETFTFGLDPNGQVITVVDRDEASTVIAGTGDGSPITVDLAMWKAWDAAITDANLVSCPSGAASQPVTRIYATTVQDVAIGAALAIAPGGNLVSWAVRNRSSTTGTVAVNGGAALPLDIAETLASGVPEGLGGLLNDTVNVTAGNGILRVTTVRRV